MATTSTSVRNLVSTQSIVYIKPMTIRITVNDVRPNARLYPFFNGERVDALCQMYVGSSGSGAVLNVGGLATLDTDTIVPGSLKPFGDPILTNAAGEVVVFFTIPGGRFTTGDKEFILTDVTDLTYLDIPGNVYGSARAIFKSLGTKEIYQKTTTNTTVVVQEVIQYARDPLAQSFFTYGMSGGMFVTSIEIFFQSKDTSIPVRLEIRDMENGYPKKNFFVNPAFVVVKNPADINVSDTALVGTKFTFDSPVYLEADKDYCFVLLSNSSNYNIWTSKLGERSLENGRLIHDQPYVGSMFKSENNITWSAEQFEDIKFNIYKAQFNTAVAADITLSGSMPAFAIDGNYFSTTGGSNLVIFNSPNMHGLLGGSKIKVDADPTAYYNGISGTNLTGTFNVTRVIDEYSVEFSVGAPATSSGRLSSCGIVRSISILNGGNGYTSAPTVTIGAPTTGTTAVATASIVNGQVSSITITNTGSGYTSAPVVTLSGGGGSGASALASNDATLVVSINKPLHMISPQLKYGTPPNTALTATLKTTNPTYGYQAPVDISLTEVTRLKTPAIIASRSNEYALMSNANSFEMQVLMTSSNPNVSPVLDFNDINGVFAYSNAINNQSGTEDITSSIASSPLATVAITTGGTGYASAPVVTVIKAENDYSESIIPATITATVSGGIVTGLNIGTYGSGYTKPPLIKIAAPSSGTTATATSTINPINSEINTAGNSYSRYITNKMTLADISQGIRLYVNAISTAETTFDWYIRTSLSGDSSKHENGKWQIMKCDVSRNRSRTSTEVLEYEFYLDNITHFDTYDLKMVPSSTTPTKTPFIKQYRVIVLA